MRLGTLLVVLLAASAAPAQDLKRLPVNTWVELKTTTVQPADPAEKGAFARQGWNKIVYDPDGKRVLFYDRWIDKKHGGWTIYGNCLFAFDPADGKLTPIKIDNWTKMEPKQGGYRTPALPANDDEPTPCPRHVYHAFEYVPDLKAVFLCNGANQTVIDKNGKLVGHDECDGTWRLDLMTNKWSKINSKLCPPNRLDDAMAYCPDTKTLIYAGTGRQIWILDIAAGQWRKAKHSPPARPCMGQTIFYDPMHKRMLILGGGRLDAWTKDKAAEFRELYAFDPKTEEVKRLADGPTAFYSSHFAFDAKNKVFVAAADFNKKEQPSGMFFYDPFKDAWGEIKPTNPIPPHKSWFGWTHLCYDAHHECLIGKVNDRFFAFRYEPAGEKPAMVKTTYDYLNAGVHVQLDVYRPNDRELRPYIVWIHGGALITGSKAAVPSQLMDLCRAEGWALVSLDYRLAPEVKLPTIAADIDEAFRWLHDKGGTDLCKLDPDRMAIAGGSAGGYLTLLAGTRLKKQPPRALVAYWGYGDVDGDWYTKPSEFYRKQEPLIKREDALKAVGGKVLTGSEPNFDGKARGRYYRYLRQNGLWTKEITGFDPATERMQLDPYCPVRNVTRDFPPTLLIHGSDDTDVPYEQSAAMAKELARHKVPHELVTVQGAGHGLSGGDRQLVNEAHTKAAAFLRERLKAKK